jgi:hypothetical protein
MGGAGGMSTSEYWPPRTNMRAIQKSPLSLSNRDDVGVGARACAVTTWRACTSVSALSWSRNVAARSNRAAPRLSVHVCAESHGESFAASQEHAATRHRALGTPPSMSPVHARNNGRYWYSRGARAVREKSVLAAAQRKSLCSGSASRVLHSLRIRAEQRRAACVSPGRTRAREIRVPKGAGRESSVVAQDDVEAWALAIDEVVLEQERFRVGVRDRGPRCPPRHARVPALSVAACRAK